MPIGKPPFFSSADVSFRVTPDILTNQASEVTNLIREVQTQFDAINTLVSKTKSYWIGEAGDAHRNMYDTQKERVEEMIRRLDEHPRDLVTMAQKYSETELQIKNLISELPSDVIM